MTIEYYEIAQTNLRRRLGIAKTAATLLEDWRAFVEECENCYAWDVSEYNAEIAVRDELGAILEARELFGFDEHHELAKRVVFLDDRFRTLLIPGASLPGKSSWWRRGVLRRAGSDYAAYFRDAHGIDVERCNGRVGSKHQR